MVIVKVIFLWLKIPRVVYIACYFPVVHSSSLVPGTTHAPMQQVKQSLIPFPVTRSKVNRTLVRCGRTKDLQHERPPETPAGLT